MPNAILNFFSDFNKLFYWLLMLTSWLLTADAVGALYFEQSVDEIFSELRISKILIIFTLHILAILTSSIIYEIIRLIWLLNSKSTIDLDMRKRYYSYPEILNKAVTDNNQTMYNYHKDSKNNMETKQNQKYLCFTCILLFILVACIENSSFRAIWGDYNDNNLIRRVVVIITVTIDALGLLALFHEKHNSDNSDIIRQAEKKKCE